MDFMQSSMQHTCQELFSAEESANKLPEVYIILLYVIIPKINYLAWTLETLKVTNILWFHGGFIITIPAIHVRICIYTIRQLYEDII